jgi:pimeloyl-ACP methyl ester carboxylesterase
MNCQSFSNYKHSISRLVAMTLVVVSLTGLPQTVAAREVTKELDGLTLNANLEIAEGNDLSSPVVLILHGMMGHYGMGIIKGSQRALLDNGRNSLAMNLSLGVDNRKGFYDCDSPHRHIQDYALIEIQAWVDWLKQQGTSEIVLLAHSRGANEAMVYTAAQADSAIKHLVLLAPGIDDSKQRFEDRYGPIFDETLSRMGKAKQDGLGAELLDGVDFWYCPQATVTPDSFISYYGNDSRFRKIKHFLTKLPVPTLVIFGTEDEVVESGHTIIKPMIDGKQLQLFVLEGAGHFFLDFNIDEAIEAMLEYLE